MKKILILNYEFPPLGGGAANATYYLLKEFAKNSDLHIDLVTSSIDTFRVEQFSDNITIHYLDIGKKGNLHYQSNKDLITYSYKAYFYVKKLMRESATFDLCHAFFGIPCGFIAMKLGIPYIVSLRGSDVPFYNKRFYWLDKLFFKRMSRTIWKRSVATIANSEELKNLALSSAPGQTIEVIYNGVDTEEFKPAEKKEDGQTLTLISTGRLIERKGYRYLIQAIASLPNVRVELIGDGNLREELENLAKAEGANVAFLGKKDRKEIIEYLQKADVFVLPSLNEGMSNSVLEAMAVGLPIIATDTGGTKELIGKNGIVVSKADGSALREAIEPLLHDKQQLKEMGTRSREQAEKMSWELVANKYLHAYELA